MKYFTYILLCLIVSCANKAINKDGPPENPRKIPKYNVVAKKMPRSKYGNPESYKVYKKTYHVLDSGRGYKKRGKASWYGKKFHKKRTSSGEPYDMYKFTAAHKTLPIPSYVKVTNLENHKELIVKVNDRGPFHEGRIIDLSYAAAYKLGVLEYGTALVEVVNINFAKMQFFIQAGSFNSKKSALRLAQDIKIKLQLPASLQNIRDKFIVRIGPYLDRSKLAGIKTKLANTGVSGSFITVDKTS